MHCAFKKSAIITLIFFFWIGIYSIYQLSAYAFAGETFSQAYNASFANPSNSEDTVAESRENIILGKVFNVNLFENSSFWQALPTHERGGATSQAISRFDSDCSSRDGTVYVYGFNRGCEIQGNRAPQQLTTQDVIDGLQSQLSSDDFSSLFSNAPVDSVAKLAQQVGIGDVKSLVQSGGGGNVAQLLSQLGIDNTSQLGNTIISAISGAGGIGGAQSVGQLLNEFGTPAEIQQFANTLIKGGNAGDSVGQLFGQFGAPAEIQQLANTFLGGGNVGDNFGQLLTQFGAPAEIQQLANTFLNGGGDIGQTVSSLLDSVGAGQFADYLDVFGGEAFGGLANSFGGSMTDFVDAFGGETWGDFAETIGVDNLADYADVFGGEEFVDFVNDVGAEELGDFADAFGAEEFDNFVGEFGLNADEFDDFEAELANASDAGDVSGGGLYVPVKEVPGPLLTETKTIREETQIIRGHISWLRQKEQSLDPSVQNAWVDVAGKYALQVINWINSAYGSGNPAYVTNPHVYYRNVDLGVSEAMIRDIEESNIDEPIKQVMIRTLKTQQIDRIFPDYIAKQFTGDNEFIFHDGNQFTWDSWIEGSMKKGNSVYEVADLVLKEYELRRSQARKVEEEKLAWGRGFFPNELCGQQVFSKDPRDIRTCKTLAPGSLIQDLSSIVLSTALRQMENADEFDERISGSALYAMSSVFWSEGLSIVPSNDGLSGPLSPAQAQSAIEDINQKNEFLKTENTRNGLSPKEKTNTYFGETYDFTDADFF